nr:Ltp family lipoprotein [Corynebacterium pyruviciproducens]
MTSTTTVESSASPTSSEATEATEKKTQENKSAEADVPKDYKNALRSAKTYSDMMHMSKQGIYDQLTSEYADQFSPEAAQYAVDNLKADYNKNALESARTYEDTMAMSPDAIYDQLISEYGDKFTAEEAQYAVDNL